MACARARFIATETGSAISSEDAAAAVQRALLLAPHLADAHFAAAILAVEEGRYGEGVDRLRDTLALAPMHALSLAMLGRLEGELGFVREGVAHLREAARIDPSTGGTLSSVARIYALRGRWDDATRILERARTLADGIDVWGTTTRLRAWRGGAADDVEDVLRRMGEHDDPMRRFVRANASFVLSRGAEGADEMRALLHLAAMLPIAARAKSFILQLGAEIFAPSFPDEALDYLEKSAAAALIDIDWIEHCPALASLRRAPRAERFRDVADIVRARAASSWPAERSRIELEAVT
jgi:eukaryotic-like serine/threonine-protein kinase